MAYPIGRTSSSFSPIVLDLSMVKPATTCIQTEMHLLGTRTQFGTEPEDSHCRSGKILQPIKTEPEVLRGLKIMKPKEKYESVAVNRGYYFHIVFPTHNV